MGTVATGLYDDGYVVLHHRGDADTIWHVRAGRVVLATGAFERPLAFADNDRPGIMLAGAARTYVERFGVLAGSRVVVFTTNHTGYEAAGVLADAGAEIVAIVDTAEGGPAGDAARARGTTVHHRWMVAGTAGDPHLTTVTLQGPDGQTERVDADLLLVSGGWDPALQLYRAVGGGLRYDEALATFVPDGCGPAWLEVVGTAAGDGLPTSVPVWDVPAGDDTRKYVELQRDQTVADVSVAVARGLRSVEHVKRATYIGTTIDQGRTSGALTAGITNQLLGWGPDAQDPSNARPPFVPVPFMALAGTDTGLLLDPVRTTSMHPSHVAARAVFEDVGQWKRPRFFPLAGEGMEDAVARECLAVRAAAGVLDASTLGKIEVVGPDAGIFLDRMYTNRMSNLAVGSIRYGLMLGLDGMVVDDGVAMRLADDRYLVTTTTGGAAMVLDRFEEWLQTEWPDLRVFCTSVTEQWAVVAVGGPRAREVLVAAGVDLDLSTEAFPYMTFREGDGRRCAGAPVPRQLHGRALVRDPRAPVVRAPRVGVRPRCRHAARASTPYGTEAMHVLRAEKGYVIVGQDTDGTATPDDLGMGWIVNPGKGDFVGQALVRASGHDARSTASTWWACSPRTRRSCSPRERSSCRTGRRAAGPDARPRHLELPRAPPSGGPSRWRWSTAGGTSDGRTALRPAPRRRRCPSRSRDRSSTTPRGRDAMDELRAPTHGRRSPGGRPTWPDRRRRGPVPDPGRRPMRRGSRRAPRLPASSRTP